jgi:hypothetical protein
LPDVIDDDWTDEERGLGCGLHVRVRLKNNVTPEAAIKGGCQGRSG